MKVCLDLLAYTVADCLRLGHLAGTELLKNQLEKITDKMLQCEHSSLLS